MKKPDAMAVRKSRLRAIDKGTRYDVAGKLRWLARQVESGELGDVRDIVTGLRTVQATREGTELSHSTYHFGTGTVAEAHHLLDCMKKDMT